MFWEILNLKILKKKFEKRFFEKNIFFQNFFFCWKLGIKLRIPLQLFSSYLKTIPWKILANMEKRLKNDHFWEFLKTARIGRFPPACAQMQFMSYCICGKNFKTIGKGIHMKISQQTWQLMFLHLCCTQFLVYCVFWRQISCFLIKNDHPLQ